MFIYGLAKIEPSSANGLDSIASSEVEAAVGGMGVILLPSCGLRHSARARGGCNKADRRSALARQARAPAPPIQGFGRRPKRGG